MTNGRKPSPEAVHAVQVYASRRLSPEEFRAYADAPFAPGELEEWHSLIAWFSRRYATASERVSYNFRRIRELYERPEGLRPPPPLRLPETPVVDLDAPPSERSERADP